MALSLTIRRLLSNQPVELPVFHPIALKLQESLRGSEFSIDEVIRLVDEDQSLAGHILRMANSSFYLGRSRVETIKEAVIRLGAQQVSNLAMAASQASLHVSNNPVLNKYLQELWTHSHATAVGCRWLAKTSLYNHLIDQAYMAGLLHDVGKLYLLKALENLNRMGVAQAALEEDLLLEIFTEMHVEQGCRILQYWNLPQAYVNVAALHHAESYDAGDTLVTIVRLVNCVSKTVGMSLQPDPDIDVLSLPEASLLQFTNDDLDELKGILEDSHAFSTND